MKLNLKYQSAKLKRLIQILGDFYENKKIGTFNAIALCTVCAVLLFAMVFISCNGEKGDPVSRSITEQKEEEIMKKAKQDYLEKILMEKYLVQIFDPDGLKYYPEPPTIDDISFRQFLGIYNGSLAAQFFGGKYHGSHAEYVVDFEIEGLGFSYSNGYPFLVWNDGIICDLVEAYYQGLLTKEDLVKIHSLYTTPKNTEK